MDKANTLIGGASLLVMSVLLSACQPTDNANTPKIKDAQIDTASVQTELAIYPDKLLWGDTHLHTSNSPDAFAFGTRLTPADSYRFARGEEVVSTTGQKAQLIRPLDFLVVADHAEGLGISMELFKGNPKLISDPKAKRWHEMLNEGGEQSMKMAVELIDAVANKTLPKTMTRKLTIVPILMNNWRRNNAVAEEFNDPGTFTTLIGYEYSSLARGNNLHRVVIFRDNHDKTDRVLPFPSIISTDPEDLWKALARYERKTGGQVLAIPHNSNLSNGMMFAKTDFSGKNLDAKYTKKSARWEPLVEITQIKGDSESHPFLSPNDEFSGFGDVGWDLGNLTLQELKKPEMFAGEYVREALKTGLALGAKTGTNPFKYGVIGSTDAHTGLSTGREDNFFGKHANAEPSPQRMHKTVGLGTAKTNRFGWQYLAGGYAGVWARSNSRTEIWDALKRKEVYGTTGPRMRVRFFGGGDFKDGDATSAKMANIGYAKGVPMGGDLQLGEGQSPEFIIAASKDPDGANLDRVQVIKGWLGADGQTHEKIYDVKWAGTRVIGAEGKLPPIGTTVDIKDASYTNTIGSAELSIVWRDPDFDVGLSAFYYVRVLEIPTPRWPVYDAKRFDAKLPKGAVMTQQERAYTSPIWYTPK